MRKTLCGLGLALSFLLSGCGSGQAGSTPSPANTGSPTSRAQVQTDDVANVDLTASDQRDFTAASHEGDDLDEMPLPVSRGGAIQGPNHNVLANPKVAFGSQGADSLVNQVATKALQGNVAEQKLAALALDRSKNRDVQDLARMIAKDHKVAEGELRQALVTKIADKPELTAQQKQIGAKLDKLAGAQFDRAYVAAMVKGHEETLKFYREQSKKAPTEALRDYFSEISPVIAKHLEHCRHLQAKLG